MYLCGKVSLDLNKTMEDQSAANAKFRATIARFANGLFFSFSVGVIYKMSNVGRWGKIIYEPPPCTFSYFQMFPAIMLFLTSVIIYVQTFGARSSLTKKKRTAKVSAARHSGVKSTANASSTGISKGTSKGTTKASSGKTTNASSLGGTTSASGTSTSASGTSTSASRASTSASNSSDMSVTSMIENSFTSDNEAEEYDMTVTSMIENSFASTAESMASSASVAEDY